MGYQRGAAPWVFGAPERRVFFSPWWRGLVTVALGLLPVALVPYLVSHPDSETWMGPASVVPIAAWLWLRSRHLRDASRSSQK